MRNVVRSLAVAVVVATVVMCGAFASSLPPPQAVVEQLDDGLRVAYVRTTDEPSGGDGTVHVRITYAVGSRDEPADRRGLAHLCEHVMFRGSAHVAPLEHERLVSSLGGSFNGATTHEFTSFFQTIPSEQLEMALYLEADRMAGLRITSEGLDGERRVVVRELQQRFADRREGLGQSVRRALFDERSPYHFSPGGSIESVARATVDDVAAWHDAWYAPNNATLVICGDFEIDRARSLAKRYFGWVPRGPQLPARQPIAMPARPEQLRRVEVDGPERAVLLVAKLSEGRGSAVARDRATALILESAMKRRLGTYLRRPDKPLCDEVLCWLIEAGDECFLIYGGEVSEGAENVDELEQALFAQSSMLAFEGVSSRELSLAVADVRQCVHQERGDLGALAAVVSREIAAGQQVTGGSAVLAEAESITGPDVLAVTSQALDEKALTLVRVRRPSGDGSVKSAAPATQLAVKSSKHAPARRAVEFPADYPTSPPIAHPDRANAPSSRPTSLARRFDVDGASVIVIPDAPSRRSGIVWWSVAFPVGADDEPPGQAGLSTLAALLVTRRTPERHYDEVGLPKQDDFTPIDFEVANRYTRFSAWVTRESAQRTLDHWRAALGGALGQQAARDFDAKQRQIANELATEASFDDPLVTAPRTLLDALLADRGGARAASAASVRAIGLPDATRFLRRVLRASGAVIMIGGDLSHADATGLARELVRALPGGNDVADSTTAPSELVEQKQAPALGRVLVVDRPGAEQSVIAVGARAERDISAEPIDEAAAAVLNVLLRNAGDSRLGSSLRVTSGLAYNWDARVEEVRGVPIVRVVTMTDATQTAAAVDSILQVLERLTREELQPSELADVMRTLGAARSNVRIKGTGQSRSERGADPFGVVLANDQIDRQLESLDPARVRALMTRCFARERAVIVVAGPGAELVPKLKNLGLAVERAPRPNR